MNIRHSPYQSECVVIPLGWAKRRRAAEVRVEAWRAAAGVEIVAQSERRMWARVAQARAVARTQVAARARSAARAVLSAAG